ncbi:MAG: BamA/TamA family outer membrane protein [Brumimicrobium sp.]
MKQLLVLLIVILPFFALSQKKDSTAYKPKIVGVPILFYGPETSLGFGAAGFFTFKMDKFDTVIRTSLINVGGAYTLENQILSYASYDLWLSSNNYNITGELGYYRYFYDFWGVGTDPKQIERYSLNFPRIRFEGVKQIYKGLYAGIKFTFDDFEITEKETGGRLAQGLYPGSNGGKISGLGTVVKYDTRDNNFYPTTGYKLLASYEKFDEIIGSDFDYHLTWVNAIRYFDLKKDKVIAANIYGRFSQGEVPFFHMAQIGGNKRMRGYYEGYHRDNQMVGWQVEYRMPVTWRFGIAAFAGNAIVGEKVSKLAIKNTKTTAGAGIRFKVDKDRKVNLRLDFAFSADKTSGIYFTFAEAF